MRPALAQQQRVRLLVCSCVLWVGCLLSPDASLYRDRSDAAADAGGLDGPRSTEGGVVDGASWDAGPNADLVADRECVFEKVEPPIARDLHAVWGQTADDVVAVGKEGAIATYGDGIWGAFVHPSKTTLNAVWGSAGGQVWAVGKEGVILRRASLSWEPESSGSSSDLFGVWVSPASGRAWAVGKEGALLERQTDGTWRQVASAPTQEDLYAIWGSGDDDVWAVGNKGVILHKDSDGWSRVHEGESLGDLVSVTGSGTTQLWLGGTKGLLRRQVGGWPTTPTAGLGGSLRVKQVWADNPTRVWVTGEIQGGVTRAAVLTWEAGSWTEIPFADGATPAVNAVWSNGSCAAWAVGQGGSILRATRR